MCPLHLPEIYAAFNELFVNVISYYRGSALKTKKPSLQRREELRDSRAGAWRVVSSRL
jgi:hypothetical protein